MASVTAHVDAVSFHIEAATAYTDDWTALTAPETVQIEHVGAHTETATTHMGVVTSCTEANHALNIKAT